MNRISTEHLARLCDRLNHVFEEVDNCHTTYRPFTLVLCDDFRVINFFGHPVWDDEDAVDLGHVELAQVRAHIANFYRDLALRFTRGIVRKIAGVGAWTGGDLKRAAPKGTHGPRHKDERSK